MKDSKVKVTDIFPEKYNCAQTVLRMILVENDIYFPEVPWITAGFGGGVGLQGEICGAVSGAIMAIGLLHSKEVKDPVKHRAITYKTTEKFIKKFVKKHTTTNCNNLIGFDINNPDERKKASEQGVFKNTCPKYVKTALDILYELFPK